MGSGSRAGFDYLLERLHQQEEVRDRWFRYSLVVLVLPVGIVGLDKTPSWLGRSAMAAMMFLFAAIGVCFLLMHVNQRANCLDLREDFGESVPERHLPRGFLRCVLLMHQFWRADFLANVIQALLNGALVIVGVYALGVSSTWVPYVALLMAVYVQLLMRQRVLHVRGTQYHKRKSEANA